MCSRWEPPEWVEETDPNSGVNYYVQLAKDATPLHSTWSAPKSFARLLRQDIAGENDNEKSVQHVETEIIEEELERVNFTENIPEEFNLDELVHDYNYGIELESNRLTPNI